MTRRDAEGKAPARGTMLAGIGTLAVVRGKRESTTMRRVAQMITKLGILRRREGEGKKGGLVSPNTQTPRTHKRSIVSSPSSSVAPSLLFQRGQRGRGPVRGPTQCLRCVACAHDEDGRRASERSDRHDRAECMRTRSY